METERTEQRQSLLLLPVVPLSQQEQRQVQLSLRRLHWLSAGSGCSRRDVLSSGHCRRKDVVGRFACGKFFLSACHFRFKVFESLFLRLRAVYWRCGLGICGKGSHATTKDGNAHESDEDVLT